MSVNNSFFAIDWSHLKAAPKDDDLAGYCFDALDAEEEWICKLPFGEQIDDYFFESWDGLIEFSDWFHEVRELLDEGICGKIESLFTGLGLLFDQETIAPDPMRLGFDFVGSWLIGSIPPKEVEEFKALADSINLNRLKKEFDRIVEDNPCELIPDGETMVNWVGSIQTGLRTTANIRRGIIIGAA